MTHFHVAQSIPHTLVAFSTLSGNVIVDISMRRDCRGGNITHETINAKRWHECYSIARSWRQNTYSHETWLLCCCGHCEFFFCLCGNNKREEMAWVLLSSSAMKAEHFCFNIKIDLITDVVLHHVTISCGTSSRVQSFIFAYGTLWVFFFLCGNNKR